MMDEKEDRPSWDLEAITDLSEKVYRQRLIDEAGDAAPQRMIEKDEDQGERLRERSRAYNPLTRAYLDALGFQPSRKNDRPKLG